MIEPLYDVFIELIGKDKVFYKEPMKNHTSFIIVNIHKIEVKIMVEPTFSEVFFYSINNKVISHIYSCKY